MKIRALLIVALVTPLLSAHTLAPQRIARADDSPLLPISDNLFTFARVQFNSRGRMGGGRRRRGGGPGWAHDYPRAERNFLNILAELTTVRTAPESYVIVQLEDPEIMRYPFLYFSEPGTWEITPEETANLKEYLDRGGFAIFDDFGGGRDWAVFHQNFKSVVPDRDLELLTVDDPIFHCFFDIETLAMGVRQGSRQRPQFFGLRDEQGRLQMIVNFNNDLGDYWEWSDAGLFPLSLSNEAYKFGVNYVVYSLTH